MKRPLPTRNGSGVASRRAGVSLLYQATALNNTFTGLTVGLEARSGEWYMPTSYATERNTFTNNAEGVSSLPPTYYNGPPTMSVTLRCNTFSSQVTGATGVWVKAKNLFPGYLGGNGIGAALTLYPNPATETVTVRYERPAGGARLRSCSPTCWAAWCSPSR
jgi:hypothetical protein